jgi:uncharacterized membrane protein YedE/YeeE
MLIDWLHFTPWQSLAGGVFIGVASSLFILLNGRILGISGIIGGLLPLKKNDISWRMTFLLGMLTAPTAFYVLAPTSLIFIPRIHADNGSILIAGLLVGLGTRYALGCTSGHGVCGLSRLSPRSLVATISFMATGFLTVFLLRHVFITQ